MAQASTPVFKFAVITSVSTSLKVPTSAITGLTVTPAVRRALLSNIVIDYTVTVDSGVTPDTLITTLLTSVSDGTFLTTLSANSGVVIAGVSTPSVTNLSPTSSPSLAPTSATASSGTHTRSTYSCWNEYAPAGRRLSLSHLRVLYLLLLELKGAIG